MLEDVTGSDLTTRISGLSDTVAYLEGKLADIRSQPYPLSVITYALTLAQSNKADEFLTALEALQESDGNAQLFMIWFCNLFFPS